VCHTYKDLFLDKRDELTTLFQTIGTLSQKISIKEKIMTITITITAIIIIIIIMIMIMIMIIIIVIKKTTKLGFTRTHCHLQLIDVQSVGS